MVEAREIPMSSRGPNGKGSILVALPEEREKNLPPLIFLHGSFHGAWCWEENFFPYFAELGYPLIALNFRGAGENDETPTNRKVTIQEHCDDLQCFLGQVLSILGYATPLPILVGHSFVGVTVMKYLEGLEQKPMECFSALIIMNSLPPSGMGKVSKRMMWRSIGDTWRMVQGMAMKKFVTDPSLCRDLFFGGKPVPQEQAPNKTRSDGSPSSLFGVSDEDIVRYQLNFARDTKVSTDTKNLSWPSMKVDQKGQAPFVDDLPPCFVMGGKEDFMVDMEGCIETANYFGLLEKGPLMIDFPHDMMLVPQWKTAADEVQKWIEAII